MLISQESSNAAEWYSEVAAYVEAGLSEADVEHVGSTSVPGCLTKGDLDVLVRVRSEAFLGATAALDGLLARSPRNVPTDDYVEYNYVGRGFSASVQLVVVDSWHDHRFHGLKALLRSDPCALDRYNGMKREYEGHPMQEYRRAKALLIESLLAGASG